MPDFKNKKLVIFDLDGCIIDSSWDIGDSANATLEHFNLPLKDHAFIRDSIGGGAANLIRRVSDNRADSFDAMLAYFKAHYLHNCTNKTMLYEGVYNTLSKLHAQKRIAMATNKLRAMTLLILEHLGVAQFFDMIVAADDLPSSKPNPECINLILENFNLTAADAVLIGDTRTDVQTGKNASVDTIGVTYGFGTREELEVSGATVIVDKMSQALELLLPLESIGR